jgi:hypothetical protein
MENKINAELDAECAKRMGWEKYNSYYCIPSSEGNDDMGGYEKRCRIKDYSPTTKIEQALEFALKLNCDVRIDNAPIRGIRLTTWMNIGTVSITYHQSLPDCARKIVETLLEVEG